MYNGLKFRGADGVERAVSADNPLPTTADIPAGAATEATLGAINTVIGTQADAAQTSAGATASLMAFLKGAITYLGSIVSKLDRLPSALGSNASTNSLSVVPSAAANGGVSSVSASITGVSIRGANASRKSLVVQNDSTATLYLLFSTNAGTVTSTNYTVALIPQERFFIGLGEYTGGLVGIWSAANGAARVTEVTG